MLIRLLRTYLLPYSGLLWAVVALQFVQTMATLLLPTLNADIIDKGILTGDTGYIWHIGAVMLARHVRPGGVRHLGRRTSAPRRPWASGATSASRCSTGSPASRPRRSTSSARRR